MTLLAIIGALVLTLVTIWPWYLLSVFYSMSDYGLKDTTVWNWKKEGLWKVYLLGVIALVLWWFLVGTYIHLGFG